MGVKKRVLEWESGKEVTRRVERVESAGIRDFIATKVPFCVSHRTAYHPLHLSAAQVSASIKFAAVEN